MRRDPTEFRKRFALYKLGKSPYKNGRPVELDSGTEPYTPYNKSIVSDLGNGTILLPAGYSFTYGFNPDAPTGQQSGMYIYKSDDPEHTPVEFKPIIQSNDPDKARSDYWGNVGRDYMYHGMNTGFGKTMQDFATNLVSFAMPESIFDRVTGKALLYGSKLYKNVKLNNLGKKLYKAIDESNINSSLLNLSPTERIRLGDVEINDPNLLYRQDNPFLGAFDHQNSFVENGILFPGKTSKPNQLDYSWWNKGNPYIKISADHPVASINGKEMPRLFTTTENNAPFLHVKSQNYPIGQWTGEKGLVTNSEYVTSKPVDVSNSTYIFEPGYGYRKVTQTPEIEGLVLPDKRIVVPARKSVDPYMKAVLEGDMKTALVLRDLHFIDSALNPTKMYTASKHFDFDTFEPRYAWEPYFHFGDEATAADVAIMKKGSYKPFFIDKGHNIEMQDAVSWDVQHIANQWLESGKITLEQWQDIMHRYGHYDTFNTLAALLDALNFANEFGFNSIDYLNMGEGPGTISTAVVSPNQIKSADPITYFKANDPEVLSGLFKAGDIIPLNMRDNFNRSDIRFAIAPLLFGASYPILKQDNATIKRKK